MAAVNTVDQLQQQQQLQQFIADNFGHYAQQLTNPGGSLLFNSVDAGHYNYGQQQQQYNHLNVLYAQQHQLMSQQRSLLQRDQCSPPDVKRPRLSSITQQQQLQQRISATGHVSQTSNEHQRGFGSAAASDVVAPPVGSANFNDRQSEKSYRVLTESKGMLLLLDTLFSHFWYIG